ncbi:hypothetical protein Clacol_006069 [Clathrus columnatus]|uniref:RNA helicase n=1 Tax=Clathrus columnatus TaxID=1419009 RepID=A0AAV5AFT7_9AGAM|nr:hypothetical protein Clacol_006069 [Clathrus columnatus]
MTGWQGQRKAQLPVTLRLFYSLIVTLDAFLRLNISLMNIFPFQQLWRNVLLRRQFHSTAAAARRGSSKSDHIKSKIKTTKETLQHISRSESSQKSSRHPLQTSVKTFRGKTSLNDLQSLLVRTLPSWVDSSSIRQRLLNLGIHEKDCEIILFQFNSYMSKQLSNPESQASLKDPWGILYLSQEEDVDTTNLADRAFTTQLLAFIVDPSSKLNLNQQSLLSIKQINAALDLRYPSMNYPSARNLRRKIYLHVGPTNSGKTYNALRALATARSGVYAGPLRLLAHEVWSRLNLGSIRPFDAPPSTAAQYARECNLLTGEEQRIVSEDATLTSCTVEIINLNKHYHVAVIDEIQMIADPKRGGSWTAAVLGVCADEIHLCGEESAVPVIEALAAETNDELVIRRYDRLTPLAVAEESLHSNWKQIQPGDCIVTFSRKEIFQIKARIEKATGLRCAVVYGRLPPETRSGQAALFNDKDSGYDVLVASDAIGMGLNLKIKRVIFMGLKKFSGYTYVFLSLSQIKQIGGRAGRFGEAGVEQGIVTCMSEEYMPILRKAFQKQTPMLSKAVMPFTSQTFIRMAEVLPSNYGLKDLYSLLYLGGNLGDHYVLPLSEQLRSGMDIVDRVGTGIRLAEKVLFIHCPVSWRVDEEVHIMTKYMKRFMEGGAVDLKDCLGSTHLLDSMKTINDARLEQQENPSQRFELDTVRNKESLQVLETLHKVLLSYIWLSFRVPASFAQQPLAMELKEQTEACIQFVLEGIADRRLLRNLSSSQLVAVGEQEDIKTKISYTQRPKLANPRLRKLVESSV